MMKRHCGSCTLCCRLLPVPEHGKLANTKCRHQFSRGCRIYRTRPASCVFWNCRWLAGDETGQRPDRAGFVVDMLPDFIEAVDHATGKHHKIGVLQVWASDDVKPEANLAFMSYLAEMGEKHRMAALVRIDGNREGYVIFPPAMTEDGKFHVHDSKQDETRGDHSPNEVAEALGEYELKIVMPKDRSVS